MSYPCTTHHTKIVIIRKDSLLLQNLCCTETSRNVANDTDAEKKNPQEVLQTLSSPLFRTADI